MTIFWSNNKIVFCQDSETGPRVSITWLVPCVIGLYFCRVCGWWPCSFLVLPQIALIFLVSSTFLSTHLLLSSAYSFLSKFINPPDSILEVLKNYHNCCLLLTFAAELRKRWMNRFWANAAAASLPLTLFELLSAYYAI